MPKIVLEKKRYLILRVLMSGDIASGWFLGFMILTVVFRILAAAHTT
jgi:hypothetical protein